MIEVRDVGHHELRGVDQVADVQRSLGHALAVSSLEGDVSVADAQCAIAGEHRSGRVRDRADATDALGERDRIVRCTSEEEVLKPAPEIAMGPCLSDVAGAIDLNLDSEVTLDT